MDRLTYTAYDGEYTCYQVHGADEQMCNEVCDAQGSEGCANCPINKAFNRLGVFEDLMEEYHIENFDQLKLALKATHALRV